MLRDTNAPAPSQVAFGCNSSNNIYLAISDGKQQSFTTGFRMSVCCVEGEGERALCAPG